MRIVIDVCSMRSRPTASNSRGSPSGSARGLENNLSRAAAAAASMPAAVSQNIRWNTKPTAKVPYGGDHTSARRGHALQFVQRDHRIGDEVENELRRRAIECCIGVRQPQRVRNLEHDLVGRGMGSRESHVGRRDVSADDAARRPFPGHRIGDAAGGTSNVQKAAVT